MEGPDLAGVSALIQTHGTIWSLGLGVFIGLFWTAWYPLFTGGTGALWFLMVFRDVVSVVCCCFTAVFVGQTNYEPLGAN